MKNINSVPPIGAIQFPDYVNAHVLAAATNETETVPAAAIFVLINVTAATYFKAGAAATIPADTTDGSASFLINPGDDRQARLFYVKDITTIAMIASGTPTVTFQYYTL